MDDTPFDQDCVQGQDAVNTSMEPHNSYETLHLLIT